MKYSQPYKDAVAIQRQLMQRIASCDDKVIANIAKGFATLETLKLRLRMKPAPKAIDVSKPVKRSNRGLAAPVEEA